LVRVAAQAGKHFQPRAVIPEEEISYA
jgi:hypothetical protein